MEKKKNKKKNALWANRNLDESCSSSSDKEVNICLMARKESYLASQELCNDNSYNELSVTFNECDSMKNTNNSLLDHSSPVCKRERENILLNAIFELCLKSQVHYCSHDLRRT